MADKYIIAVKTDTQEEIKLLVKDNGDGTYSPASQVTILGSNVGTSVSASETRPNDTTAYAAGDVVGQNPAINLTFTDVLTSAGGAFVVLGARVRIDVAAIPAGMTGFRLHLYSAAPTAIADNAAFNLPAADRDKYLGYLTISTGRDVGDTVWYQDDALNVAGKLATGSTTLYGILETIGAYTPTAQTVKTIILTVAGV